MKRAFRYVPTAFISGTFADMVEWRQAACDVLQRVQIFPIDLALAANTHEPTEDYINADLDDAHVLIGIYGLRYGSLKNAKAGPPSWSHHEYNRHAQRVARFLQGPDRPETLILLPAQGSDALRRIHESARSAYLDLGLTEEEMAADRALQLRFLKVVHGEEPDFADSESSTPPSTSPAAKNKLVARFENVSHLREEVLAHLHRVGFSRKLVVGDTEDTEPPQPPSRVALTLSRAARLRLAVDPRPAGLCVIVPRVDGIASTEWAGVLAEANPWDVEDTDDLINAGGDRGTTLMRILQDYARSQYSIVEDSLEALTAGIARAVAGYEEPEMFRLLDLPRGFVVEFIERVWPVLEARLRTEKAASGNAEAGLLMILASDTSPGKLAKLCQRPTDKPKPPAIPLMLDEAAFETTGPHRTEPTITEGLRT